LASRTALRVSGGIAGAVVNNHAANRVTAAQQAVDDLVRAHSPNEVLWETIILELPCQCDSTFTSRDDFGVEGNSEPLSIGFYDHGTQAFADQRQFIYMLHVELTASWRPASTMASPLTTGI
jgi:hypothetical protein